MTSPSPIDRMKEYKGPVMPPIFVPLIGFALGATLPYVLATRALPASWSSLPPSESVLLCLQAFGLVFPIFLAEFFLGALARSSSAKASFSPAAAQASGTVPFEVVQANRIHQNHIEALCILAPAALAAAAAGADMRWVVARLVSWVVFRVAYRFGYCRSNPFWRILGTVASLLQSVMVFVAFVKVKIQYE